MAWAVVAGASEGLGAAFAKALAARGHPLLLLARRKDALEAVAAPLRAQVEVVTHAVDLAAPIDAGLFAEREIDVLVCNAAYAPLGPFDGQALDEKLRAIDVNVRAPVALTHLLLPKMIQRKRGAVFVMSSLTAFQGSPYLSVYGATKAFGLSFAEALWAEAAPHGVKVVAVCAGATRTPGYLKTAIGKAPGELEPDQVAEEALAAAGPVVIPGAFNRFASFLMRRLMPRSSAVALMGGQTRKLIR